MFYSIISGANEIGQFSKTKLKTKRTRGGNSVTNEKFITQMYICVLRMPRPKNPNKKNITLMVDGILYEKYRNHCLREGLLVSRQFEKLMEKELKVLKNG